MTRNIFLSCTLAMSLALPIASHGDVVQDRADVQAAILTRIADLRSDALQTARSIRGLPIVEANALRAEVFQVRSRVLQLVSIYRTVPQMDSARLQRIVTFYGLSVSPS